MTRHLLIAGAALLLAACANFACGTIRVDCFYQTPGITVDDYAAQHHLPDNHRTPIPLRIGVEAAPPIGCRDLRRRLQAEVAAGTRPADTVPLC